MTLYTGNPGAGKSFAAVRLIADAVMKGKPVATNVALVPDWHERLAEYNPLNRIRSQAHRDELAEKYRRLVFITDDLPMLFRVRLAGEGESRGLMVIEEGHRRFNARTWNAAPGMTQDEAIRERLAQVQFFSAHRHYGFDIAFITQNEGNVDKQIRTLAEYRCVLKNLKRFKPLGIRVFPNLFVAITVWNDGQNTIVNRQVYTLSKQLRRLYHTHALEGVDMPHDAIIMPGAVG